MVAKLCVHFLRNENILIVISTVKPLYSEQSRDPKKCSLYGGVQPRGVRYVHAHMCLKYNVHILKLTSQISLTFDSLLSLNFSSKFKFHSFCWHANKDRLDVHTTPQYDGNLQTDWNLAISLKHCCHDWDRNKTLSIWYLRSLATMDLHQARCAYKLSPAFEVWA